MIENHIIYLVFWILNVKQRMGSPRSYDRDRIAQFERGRDSSMHPDIQPSMQHLERIGNLEDDHLTRVLTFRDAD